MQCKYNLLLIECVLMDPCTVENTKVMLGTFSPQQEPYTYELEEETTPSGLFARGSYSAKTKVTENQIGNITNLILSQSVCNALF